MFIIYRKLLEVDLSDFSIVCMCKYERLRLWPTSPTGLETMIRLIAGRGHGHQTQRGRQPGQSGHFCPAQIVFNCLKCPHRSRTLLTGYKNIFLLSRKTVLLCQHFQEIVSVCQPFPSLMKGASLMTHLCRYWGSQGELTHNH